MDSSLYERLLIGKDKQQILNLSKKGRVAEKPSDLVKDLYDVVDSYQALLDKVMK